MAVKGDPDAANGDVKPEATKHTLTIRLGANEDELTIKVKGTTKFSKIYAAVANQTGKDIGSFRLQWDGTRLSENDTPESMDFEEEECIDVHIAQIGGAPSSAR